MNRRVSTWTLAGTLIALLPGVAPAVTREVAGLQQARFTFGQSVLNQLTYDIYRDPFDELQNRPYNLLFVNIGRYPTLTPWQGQEGSYTNYVNTLIGNNGTANVDNGADAIQGGWIRRETPGVAWGVSGAYLAGIDGNDDTSEIETFSGSDDLDGYDLRGASAIQLWERAVLGVGIRMTQAGSEVTDFSFETGVGGFSGIERFEQSSFAVDAGMRMFQTSTSSWEAQVIVEAGSAEQDESSENLDDGGAVTERFVLTNYDISELNWAIRGGYNRLRMSRLGELEFRGGYEQAQRELDNDDLAFSEAGGVVTPNLTLLGQEPVSSSRMYISAKSIFQAGETEMFAAAQLAHGTVSGSTEVDAAGTIVNEEIDDQQMHLGLTVGLRQPLFRERLRFIVSGHADMLDEERGTIFDTGSELDESSLSTAQYAIGLEGVLANVTFDLAWLNGTEEPVVPVELGLPGGSRRTVELDQLVFSAAAAW